MSGEWGPGPVFSNGGWIYIEVLRDAAMLPEALAGAVGMEVEPFLEELEAWATGIGVPYGIRVDRDARTITALGAPA